ncbi:MAG: PD40 domain-containing protein [Flavobacteriales bacterium]|nr:PD40 domain-containing protein [Flavobacteriales bacterium]
MASRIVMFISLMALLCPLFTYSQVDPTRSEFGKNRIQYEQRYWFYYNFEKYDVYFYQGGEKLAELTAKYAEAAIEEAEARLNYDFDEKIELLVYNKLSDFQQSNIGLSVDNEVGLAGKARIHGSKGSLYFEGDYELFFNQIRSVITEMLVNKIMYGGTIRERVRSEVFITLPEWYSQGLVSYLVSPNDIELNNKIRDSFIEGSFDRYNAVSSYAQVQLGHALWGYISKVYGERVVSNILYMTHLSRNIESGFLFVLGVSLKTLYQEFLVYNNAIYSKIEVEGDSEFGLGLIGNPKKDCNYYQARISPDGTKLIYASNILGQYKVWIKNLDDDGKAQKILKVDHKLDRIVDYSYPILAWHPTGSRFSMITERKGKIWLTHYKIKEGEFRKREVFKFEKVLTMDYSDDGRRLVFSAVKNGQTDIFVYTVSSTAIKQITNDIYDDSSPKFMDGTTKIIFSSNRPSDTLKNDFIQKHDPLLTNNDLFIYDNVTNSNILRRVTDTEDWDETAPEIYGKGHLAFLSNKRGVQEKYIMKLDSEITHVDTTVHYKYFSKIYRISEYNRSIKEHHYSSANKKYVQLLFSKGKYRIFSGEIQLAEEAIIEEVFTEKKGVSSVASDTKIEYDVERILDEKKDQINIEDYQFDFEGLIGEESAEMFITINMDSVLGDTIEQKFELPDKHTYKPAFVNDYFNIRALNNNIVAFSFRGGVSQPLQNAFLQVGVSDLMEDYRITGGINSELKLFGKSDNESFLVYQDVSQRLDRIISFYRQSIKPRDFPNSTPNSRLNKIEYSWKWPFSEVLSVRFGATAIHVNDIIRPEDLITLAVPNIKSYYGGVNSEIVFDNTIKKGLNLYSGTRTKMGIEFLNELNGLHQSMFKVSLDYRHYQKIHREFILATRVHAKTSIGSIKENYRLGAVDNWISQNQIEDQIFNGFDNTQNYKFQSYATSMRGFRRDIRNGNSYVIISNELRLPINKYLSATPMRSEFITNFQIIGFMDIGTAWIGPSPFNEVNQTYSRAINLGEVNVYIKDFSDPIVYGYGFGVRSTISNYFVRADWGRGIEDGVRRDRGVFYFSVGLDF